MIISYNVCEHCGSQTEISNITDDTGFEFHFCTFSLKDSARGQKPWPGKFNVGSFCDRNCLLEYLKANLDEKGNTASK